MTTLPEGLHDIPADRYHADPCLEPSLSASLAATLLEATPRHAWTASPRLNPQFEPENKTAFDIGSAVHTELLGSGTEFVLVDHDNYLTKAAKAQRDEAYANGQTPLTRPQWVQVQDMATAARAQLAAHGLHNPFETGKNEQTLIWQADGIWNRCMVDCIDAENRVFYDLKTTAGYANPEAWVRTAMNHWIDLRAAHYLDGAAAILGGEWSYRFVVVEKAPPHCLSVIELTAGALALGTKKLARARQMWRHCLSKGTWPGYSAEIAVVEPPMFCETRWLEREVAEDEYRQATGKDVLEAAMRFQSTGSGEEQSV